MWAIAAASSGAAGRLVIAAGEGASDMEKSISYLLNRKECNRMVHPSQELCGRGIPPVRLAALAQGRLLTKRWGTPCLAVASKITPGPPVRRESRRKSPRLENRETRGIPHERIHIAETWAKCPIEWVTCLEQISKSQAASLPHSSQNRA